MAYHAVQAAAQLVEDMAATRGQEFRERAADEREPAEWRDAKGSMVRGACRLRSVESEQQVSILLVNLTPSTVLPIWLDYRGNEFAYRPIEPNAKSLICTFQTHPWIVREQGAGHRLVLGGMSRMVWYADASAGLNIVNITVPEPLEWSMTSHKHFPETFKATVRALLLAAKRAEQAAHLAIATLTPGPEGERDGAIDAGASQPAAAPTAPSGQPCGLGSMLPTWPVTVTFLRRLFTRRTHIAPQAAGPRAPEAAAAFTSQEGQERIHLAFLQTLSSDLLVHIISAMAPPVLQCVTLQPDGHPAIQPVLLPSPPDSWEAYNSDGEEDGDLDFDEQEEGEEEDVEEEGDEEPWSDWDVPMETEGELDDDDDFDADEEGLEMDPFEMDPPPVDALGESW